MAGVKVTLGGLRDAAAKYGQNMGRAPPGAKGKIAPDTLLRQSGEQLMVDTPFLATGVDILDGSWSGEVSVQAKAFSNLLNEHAKIWKDVGGDKAEVWLSFADGVLTLRWTDGKNARTQTLPARKNS